ncbi:TMAO reductase system periplasmic protein TorT [Ancylobacter sp. WKF20]|uniref:TMAO reductase system periplasmic protein TorT n=1 Tax=Ancylobacter sp. WKF20 TaxID=3039801 RepID=UPI002434472B|nr:TMAO reductase system periplasmic protein TorT [Ancylobacter sp. WKF20]WGD31112.1 TMAO reductase system periplasmic protein TorT [Ancylobacter sp. WKF20]
MSTTATRSPVLSRLRRRTLASAALLAFAATSLSPAAAETKWFPMKIYDASSGAPKAAEYTPLAKAGKPYNICVLFPHMKDSFWVAVAYGIVKQAETSNVNMNLYEAGGYENLPKQLSQFDDCMAAKADAIIVGAISGAGLMKKFEEAKAKGIPVVGVTNPLPPNALPAANYVDFVAMGEVTGEGLLAQTKPGEKLNIVTFPGPAGSGWAESFNEGFKKAVAKNPDAKILGEKFGDSGVAVQLQLIQDALQAYPSINVIWGTAPTAEAAIGAVAEAGRSDIKIVSSYENQAMLDALNRGDILAFATQYPVGEGAIAIDQAIRLIEKKPVMSLVQPVAAVIDKTTVPNLQMDLVLAPASWSPVYSVKAK